MVQSEERSAGRQVLSWLRPSRYRVRSLQIGSNLASFLRSARESSPSKARTWFWIDAICINQEDNVGLASDADVLVPRPYYSAAPSEVFKDLTVSIIKARSNLDVLFLASEGKSQFEGIPTWSMYEDSGWGANPLNPWRVVPQADLVAVVPDTEFHATGSSVTSAQFSESSSVVILQGFIIDFVDGLGSLYKAIQGKDTFGPFENPEYRNNIYSSDENTFVALWQTLVCGLQRVVCPITIAPNVFGEVMLNMCLDIEKELLQGRQCSHPKGPTETISGAWYNHHREFKFAGRSMKSWIEVIAGKLDRLSQPSNMSSGPSPEDVKFFELNMECALRGRRIMTSTDGYIGMAPAAARSGDVVCILLGGKMPVILRPVKDSRFEFIGECYVHGKMWGEAIDAMEKVLKVGRG
jgi:hypothetical protein